MQVDRLQILLSQVANGEVALELAVEELRNLPFESIEFANIDQHRHLRQGVPEVIFCQGKTSEQIVEIAHRLKRKHDLVIATRCSAEQAVAIQEASEDANYYSASSTVIWGSLPDPDGRLGRVCLITAGTADLPVAREAEITLSACAVKVDLIADIGVAGLHRVISCLPKLQAADVCIVVAGMDGALPSVVGGLVKCPVIACPTSIGYGSSFEGLAALLTMLNSCAAGVTVVNIDNGFGAAMAAFRILSRNVTS